MLNEMRIAAYVTKIADKSCFSGTAREMFNSATLGGAKGIGRTDLGRICPGALADIAIVNMESINMSPIRDPIKNLVYYSERSDVRTVIIDGKIIVEDGKVLDIDEKKLIKNLQQVGERMWKKIPDNHPLQKTADDLSPPSFKRWQS
jgi:cytosine/adenosine deaminase-related metal-dependent hydrolase